MGHPGPSGREEQAWHRPRGTTALGAMVQMGGSQVFPAQQIAYGHPEGHANLDPYFTPETIKFERHGKRPSWPRGTALKPEKAQLRKEKRDEWVFRGTESSGPPETPGRKPSPGWRDV